MSVVSALVTPTSVTSRNEALRDHLGTEQDATMGRGELVEQTLVRALLPRGVGIHANDGHIERDDLAQLGLHPFDVPAPNLRR